MKTPIQINDDLLISYLMNEVTAEQIQQVTKWRTADAANERRFAQFKLIWDSSKHFKADDGIDARLSLQKLKQRAAERKTSQVKVLSLYSNYSWLKIAAAVIFIAGCTWFYFNKFGSRQLQFETQTRVKTDTLPDGSMITLNKNTLFNCPAIFTGNDRSVALIKGEAFFNVAHNKAKPFIITAGSTIIKVVGTSFNVTNKNGVVAVIVATGIVQVNKNGSTVLLKPGEMVRIEPGTHKLTKTTNPDQLYDYYHSREFVANNVPLQRLVVVLNEAYNSHIIIQRKELKNLPLNTTFKTDDSLDDILNVISKTFKITVEKKPNQIILK